MLLKTFNIYLEHNQNRLYYIFYRKIFSFWNLDIYIMKGIWNSISTGFKL